MAEDITHPFNDVPDSGILAKNEIDVADRVMSKTTQKPAYELSVLLGLEDAPTAVAPPPPNKPILLVKNSMFLLISDNHSF